MTVTLILHYSLFIFHFSLKNRIFANTNQLYDEDETDVVNKTNDEKVGMPIAFAVVCVHVFRFVCGLVD